jgi:hypothetical protein
MAQILSGIHGRYFFQHPNTLLIDHYDQYNHNGSFQRFQVLFQRPDFDQAIFFGEQLKTVFMGGDGFWFWQA